MALTRLSLSDFRNHADLSVRPHARFIVLHGPNGAGKTNILEAVSLLVPGRGLRQAALRDMQREGGPGGFSVAAEIEDIKLGTGVDAKASDRRKVRINGANASAASLSEWLAMVWLTPAMDRLFADSASGRRRFLDRLVLGLEPSHARHSSQYERAMRQRNKLLTDERPADPAWLDGLEAQMAASAVALNTNRARLLELLGERLSATPDDVFAVPQIALDSDATFDGEQLTANWRQGRVRDATAGRTLIGPHRADMIVTHAGKQQVASQCSTGEQKALLLSTILAHAALVAEARSEVPVILLDEAAAHLDPSRRLALFERLAATGGQVWMTGTEPALFDGIGNDAQMIGVAQGQVASR